MDSLRTRMFVNKVDIALESERKEYLQNTCEVTEHVHDEVEHTFPDVKHIMFRLNPADIPG